jgi:hypothetical protein
MGTWFRPFRARQSIAPFETGLIAAGMTDLRRGIPVNVV